MTTKLEEALQNVEMTYQELVQIANEMLAKIFDPVNLLVEEVSDKANNLTIDQIRDYLLKLQLKAFEISEIKEKSAFKADLAEALQKEAFAISFSSLEGTATVKEKLALMATSEQTVTETLYTLAANLLKAKVDQLHRLVAVLTSILMSRMSEAKFMNMGSDSNIPNTVSANGRTILTEVIN